MGSIAEKYFWLHAVILGIILVFLFRNKKEKPSQLNLRNKMQKALDKHQKTAQVSRYDQYVQNLDNEKQSIRELSCMFMFNGHCYDAYESLGIPAGSSYEKVIDAYQLQVRESDLSKREFLLAALQAVDNSFKKAN